MTTLNRLAFLVCVALALSACGGGSAKSETPPSDTPTPPPAGNRFPDNSLWGSQVNYKTFDSTDKSEVVSVVSSSLGSVCYILREAGFSDITTFPPNWHSTLECLNQDNEIYLTLQHYQTGLINKMHFMPDGNLIVAELIKTNDSSSNYFELQISQYSAQGTLINQAFLEDSATDKELLYYPIVFGELLDPEPNPNLMANNRPQLYEHAIIQFRVANNSLYLLAYTYGIKVYKLSENLVVEWSTQVMPLHSFLITPFLQNTADFVITEAGDVVVAMEGFQAEANAYGQHFNRDLNKTDDLSDIFIVVLNSAGEFVKNALFGKAQYSEQLVGVETHNQTLWLAANVRHNKNNPESNSNTEWDLLLSSYNLENNETLTYELIDINKEDYAEQFHSFGDGRFLFNGLNGFDQADTNSQTSNGAGMLVEVDETAAILNTTTLSAPRNVIVKSSATAESGQIFFAGSYDGPITHTCEQDETLCYQKGMVGEF